MRTSHWVQPRISILSSSFGFALAFLICCPCVLLSQGTVYVPPAMEELNIPASPAAQGMGGSAAILPSIDATATIDNPAQLGLFSLAHTFGATMLAPKTAWFPSYQYQPYDPRWTLDVSAFNAGFNLADAVSIPVPLSIGLGYARSIFDLGYYLTPPPGAVAFFPPGAYGTHPVARTEIFSLGIGVDYWIRLGFGVNFKHIFEDDYAFDNPSGSVVSSSSAWAHDIGLLLVVPIADIVSRASGRDLDLVKGLSPQLNLSTGYVLANVGREIREPGSTVDAPLPRKARLGLGLEASLKTTLGASDWKLISASIVRQAETDLWHRRADGTVLPYGDGAGAINFLQNVVGGKYTGNVWVRKGWQLELGECVTIRGGSVGIGASEVSYMLDYETRGYSLSLAGLLRAFEYISSTVAGDSWLVFIANHFDLQYSRGTYEISDNPIDGTSFQAFNLVVKGLPWQ